MCTELTVELQGKAIGMMIADCFEIGMKYEATSGISVHLPGIEVDGIGSGIDDGSSGIPMNKVARP
ncbi:hypothetical protein J2T61_001142 [Methanocalculus sp. AMF5]|uniref:hypothetical protein n=1 Tax=Methanocalculus sp. AMF5 TaxID=1198257 RepID=UPI00209EB078|nr:hypothetical protein [Methanocalculus sp. AMF5]MCP1662462.1 hypothetical protein [Methanocalculus sp. AMF5]